VIKLREEYNRKFGLYRPYLIIGLFLIIFFVYGAFLKKHYALDTYVVEVNGNQGDLHIQLGRFLSGVIWKLLSALGVNTALYQSFFTLLAICLLVFSSYLIIRLFIDLKEEYELKSFILLCLSSLVSVCHVFMLHWFLFPEVVAFMMSGLILSILAVFCLRGSGAKKWFFCYVLLVAAISFYQAVGAFFVIFGMLYVGIRRAKQPLISVFRGLVTIFLIYGLAGATNILGMKLNSDPTSRTNFQYTDPLKNMYGIIGSLQEKLQNTDMGSAPVYVFSLLVFFVLVGSILLLWKSSDKKGTMRNLIVLAALMISFFMSIMAPHFLTSSIDVSPRSIVALMSLPGVISIFLLLRTNLFNKRFYFHFLFGFLVIFLVVNTYITQSVQTSRFATNRLDKEMARIVFSELLRYEKETGKIVQRIAFRHDEKPSLCYPELICYGNFRAMGNDWTIVPLLSLVSGRRFEEIKMPDSVYEGYFGGKNWDFFSEKQILIQEDTLFLMLY
jgi:hypothetical protein